MKRDTNYSLHGHILEVESWSKYLGVNISDDLTWRDHIKKTASKANRTVGFLRRNMWDCSKRVRNAAYVSLAQPVVEYACAAWDPHTTEDINRLDQVQRRSARFVCNNYKDRTPGCVTQMTKDLNWQQLPDRRRKHRLSMLYKIQNKIVDVDASDILRPNYRRTRGQQRLYQSRATPNVYKFSFYPRTIHEWNLLPSGVTESPTVEAFQTALSNHYSAVFQRQ